MCITCGNRDLLCFFQQYLFFIGLTAFLAVGAASSIESKLIHLSYKGEVEQGKEENVKQIAYVGKGLTFDSGGILCARGAILNDTPFDMHPHVAMH